MINFEPFIVRDHRGGYGLYLEHMGRPTGDEVQTVIDVVIGSRKLFEPQQPPINFSTDNAQKLLDALYNAGLRPSEEVPTTKTESALKAHLADMRKIVATKLKVEL